MRLLKILACFVVAICLSGCYSFPTATLDAVNSAYIGQHVDGFFLEHGLPQSSYELANGDMLYEWASNVYGVRIPVTTTTTGSINSFGGLQAHSTSYGGGTIKLHCELRIQTSSDGIVGDIKLTNDTIGRWKVSRFAELFSEYKKARGKPTSLDP